MDVYLEEYTAPEAIRRYTHKNAGHGIAYLLEHDYANVYLKAIEKHLQAPQADGLRMLEYGCGGGMNIITLLSLLERRGMKVAQAYGTDFSDELIKAANEEARQLLEPGQQKKLEFAVARNEELVSEMSDGLDVASEELRGSFHVIIGVNTFRYGHRLGKQAECAKGIASLLAPGGISIMIDMNSRFPAFRSKFRDRREKPEIEIYLPSLEEYTSPFADAGLEILKSGNFCWVPHSAGPGLLATCRLLSPALNLFARPFAMRSLVISRRSLNG